MAHWPHPLLTEAPLSLCLSRPGLRAAAVTSRLSRLQLCQGATHLQIGSPSLNRPHTERLLATQATATASQRALLDAAPAPPGPGTPMRIVPIYQFENADPAFAEALTEDVMPRAIKALSRALWLRQPVQGPLRLPRRCTSTCGGNCHTTGPLCGDGTLPEPVDENIFGDFECAAARLLACPLTARACTVHSRNIRPR